MKSTALAICAILLVMVARDAEAQRISIGTCPILTPMPNINPALIAGRWFEHSRSPSINEHGLRCVTGSVTFNNGFAIRYTAKVKITDIRVNLNGNANFAAGNNVGSLLVTFNNPKGLPFTRSRSQLFTIIANDGMMGAGNMANTVVRPPTFMTLHTCKNIGFARLETSYILTAMQFPPPTTVLAARNTLIARSLPADNLKEVDQLNC